MSEQHVHDLAEMLGGEVHSMERFPDGSGAAVVTCPLPADHWLTAPGRNVPPMPMRTGTDDPSREHLAEMVRAAARYAIRTSTMNGTEDYDPDAMVQNIVVGLLGYWTHSGLSSDKWANPQLEASHGEA